MRGVRSWSGHARVPSSSPPTRSARSGRSTARTSAAGRSTTCRARRPTPTGSTPRSPAAGSASDPALRRRRPDVGPVGKEFRYDGVPGHAPVVRRHAAPWEFARVWHLEPVADRPRTPSTPGSRTRRCSARRRRQDVAGAARAARHGSGRTGSPGAGGMCLHTILLDPRDPAGSSSPSRRRARSAPTTPARRGGRSTAACAPRTSPTRRRGRPLRPPHRDAPRRARRAVHAEALGRHAQRRRRRVWREVSGNLPSDFGFPIDVHAHEPGDRLRRARSRATPSTSRPRASCASTAAARAATSGSR
jgi:hypothetical protein